MTLPPICLNGSYQDRLGDKDESTISDGRNSRNQGKLKWSSTQRVKRSQGQRKVSSLV